MTVFRLQFDDFVEIVERLLELVREQIAFGAFVNVTGLVIGQFDSFG
jgi:hypothetical protein